MRGKLVSFLCLSDHLGNIPAYAGKTHRAAYHQENRREHPRVCGENPTTTIPAGQSTGTSPRMRGKHCGPLPRNLINRNIPAYAGKTHGMRAAPPAGKEHPRVCGENKSDLDLKIARLGTSPRMRGKPLDAVVSSFSFGNIPAYAGKTSSLMMFSLLNQEHPRVCGENGLLTATGWAQVGTSPRMRGKHQRTLQLATAKRNIPAYAGKTSPQPCRRHGWWEHPRVCGENRSLGQYERGASGTSPRMRGKPPRCGG